MNSNVKVLNSESEFLNHYVTKGKSILAAWAALTTGGGAAGGVAYTAFVTAVTTATQASLWSTFAGWPLIGTFCAGKAAAVGTAAGWAVLGSASVLVPAALVGVGIAGTVYYCSRGKKRIQKGTGAENLARVFSRIAFLPMLAVAVSVCRSSPESEDDVRAYVLKQIGAWGYSEAYVREGFAEAMRYTPAELNGEYNLRMAQLEKGSTQDLGVSSKELPAKVVKTIAEDFKKDFEACLG